MAKVSSTARPSSRQSQTAPQVAPPATAPGRTTRATRAQSNEIEASEPPTPRRTRRQASVESDTNAVASRGGRAMKNAVATELTPVAEDALAQEGENGNGDADQLDAVGSPAVSAGRYSAISGTTAKTSFSQEQIQDLDSDLLLDSLPNLINAADDVANLLTPAAGRPVLWKEIRTEGTRANKLYKNRLNALNLHKVNFGSQEYIQPDIIVRALLGATNVTELPDAPWRPDNAIYKVNLMQMLLNLLVHCSEAAESTEEAYQAIGRLDSAFPELIAGRDSSKESFDLSLAITTQHAIAQLSAHESHPRFSASQIIRETFLGDESDSNTSYKHILALGFERLAETEQESRQQRVADIVRSLEAPFTAANKSTISVSVAQLRADHSTDNFVAQAVRYYSSHRKRCEREIDAAGGLQTIMEGLSEAMALKEEYKLLQRYRASFGKKGSTPRARKDYSEKKYVKRLKDIARQNEQQKAAVAANAAMAAAESNAATAPVAQMTQPALDPSLMPEGDGWIRQDVDDDFNQLDPSAAQPATSDLIRQLSSFQDVQGSNAQRAANRFIDRQDGATRVPFEDTQRSQYPPPSHAFIPPGSVPDPLDQPHSTLGKHARVDDEMEDFEPTQDEGFQTDTRGLASADQKRREIPFQQQYNQESSNNTPGPSRTSGIPANSPPKRSRKNPGSAIPPPTQPRGIDEPPLENESFYARAKINAKQGRIMASQNKPPQTRRPWDDEEEGVLVDLIVDHGEDGISYAELKKIEEANENKLKNRNAEDIRFKARNMKLTMLLAHLDLPPNWDQVKLDRKAIDKLTARGVHYYQDQSRAPLDQ